MELIERLGVERHNCSLNKRLSGVAGSSFAGCLRSVLAHLTDSGFRLQTFTCRRGRETGGPEGGFLAAMLLFSFALGHQQDAGVLRGFIIVLISEKDTKIFV